MLLVALRRRAASPNAVNNSRAIFLLLGTSAVETGSCNLTVKAASFPLRRQHACMHEGSFPAAHAPSEPQLVWQQSASQNPQVSSITTQQILPLRRTDDPCSIRTCSCSACVKAPGAATAICQSDAQADPRRRGYGGRLSSKLPSAAALCQTAPRQRYGSQFRSGIGSRVPSRSIESTTATIPLAASHSSCSGSNSALGRSLAAGRRGYNTGSLTALSLAASHGSCSGSNSDMQRWASSARCGYSASRTTTLTLAASHGGCSGSNSVLQRSPAAGRRGNSTRSPPVNPEGPPAFVFDIDGVLIRGGNVLPEARRALAQLYDSKSTYTYQPLTVIFFSCCHYCRCCNKTSSVCGVCYQRMLYTVYVKVYFQGLLYTLAV